MSPIFVSPPSRPSIGVLIACASTGSALTANPAARQAATKPRRSTRTSGTRLFRSESCRSLRVSSMMLLSVVQLSFQRWAMLPCAGRGLKGVRELQHRKIGAIPADDLDAHGQRRVIRRKARRHRNSRVARDGDVVAALHPVEIVVELYACDLARPLRLHGVGRELVHGADEEIVLLEEGAHALIELRTKRGGARDLLRRKPHPLLDVPLHRVL